MKILENLKYSSNHEWLKVEEEFAYIGITDFAQDQLGEVLFVEMPEVGDELEKGSDFGVVESSKVASDLVSPLCGEVVKVNEKLEDEPELINQDPYGSWIIKLKMTDDSQLNELLNASEYESGLK